MSKEEKAPEKAEGEAAAPPPKSKKKLFIILGIVLLIVGAGVPVLFLGGGEKKEEGAAAEEEHEEESHHYAHAPLDVFVVNLAANSSFLKVGILLEYDPAVVERAAHGGGGGSAHGGGGSGGGEKEGGLPAAIAAREPMIRDAVIRILSSKRAEEVLSPEGKDLLKEELIEAINAATGLEEGPIVNIYFTEFMVQ